MLAVVLSAGMSHAAEFEAISRFRALFDGASIGILELGPDGRAREANPAVTEMLGYSATELEVTGFRDYTHSEDAARSAALFAAMMDGRSDSYRAELRYCRRDGEVMWAQHTASLERDADGRPAFAVTMLEDITPRKRAEQELVRQSELSHKQSRHDSLTGLPNRVRFGECVDQAIRSAARRREQVAVLMLDLDRFKEVNARSATRRATPCCRRSRGGSRAACARPTRSRGSAGTSSGSSSPRSRATRTSWR